MTSTRLEASELKLQLQDKTHELNECRVKFETKFNQ